MICDGDDGDDDASAYDGDDDDGDGGDGVYGDDGHDGDDVCDGGDAYGDECIFVIIFSPHFALIFLSKHEKEKQLKPNYKNVYTSSTL